MVTFGRGDNDPLNVHIGAQAVDETGDEIIRLLTCRTHNRDRLHLNMAGWSRDRRKIGIVLRERRRNEKAQNNSCGPKADGKQADYRGDLQLETSISSTRNENAE